MLVPLAVATSKRSRGANIRRSVLASLIFFLMFFLAIRSTSDGPDGSTKCSDISLQLPFFETLKTMRVLVVFERFCVDCDDAVKRVTSPSLRDFEAATPLIGLLALGWTCS